MLHICGWNTPDSVMLITDMCMNVSEVTEVLFIQCLRFEDVWVALVPFHSLFGVGVWRILSVLERQTKAMQQKNIIMDYYL